jgi:hypothetical protein
LVLAASAAACASLGAGSAPVRPALEAPEPPPRTVAPIPEPDPEAPGTASPTPVIVTAPPPTTRSSRPPAAKHPPEKDPTPPPPVVPPVETPPRAADPAGAALQTTANVTETERRVRALVAKAVKDLDQLDARKLSAGAKAQYDSARRFVSQAEEALKAMNLVFAEQLADKAAALAAGLLGR